MCSKARPFWPVMSDPPGMNSCASMNRHGGPLLLLQVEQFPANSQANRFRSWIRNRDVQYGADVLLDDQPGQAGPLSGAIGTSPVAAKDEDVLLDFPSEPIRSPEPILPAPWHHLCWRRASSRHHRGKVGLPGSLAADRAESLSDGVQGRRGRRRSSRPHFSALYRLIRRMAASATTTRRGRRRSITPTHRRHRQRIPWAGRTCRGHGRGSGATAKRGRISITVTLLLFDPFVSNMKMVTPFAPVRPDSIPVFIAAIHAAPSVSWRTFLACLPSPARREAIRTISSSGGAAVPCPALRQQDLTPWRLRELDILRNDLDLAPLHTVGLSALPQASSTSTDGLWRGTHSFLPSSKRHDVEEGGLFSHLVVLLYRWFTAILKPVTDVPEGRKRARIPAVADENYPVERAMSALSFSQAPLTGARLASVLARRPLQVIVDLPTAFSVIGTRESGGSSPTPRADRRVSARQIRIRAVT
jgi:hypothetical protein